MPDFFADYHMHTCYSDGRDAPLDMALAAVSRGLDEIAITEHGPNVLVIGIGKNKIPDLADEIAGISGPSIRVRLGLEANIISMDGDLDVPPGYEGRIEWLVAGLHPFCVPTSAKDGLRLFAPNHLRRLGPWARRQAVNNNTKAVIAALDKNRVDVLAHPGLFFSVDVQEVARACVRNEVLFEINCGHEWPPPDDIMEAGKVGVTFIAGSDAHKAESVGKLEYALRIAKRLKLDPDRIANLRGERPGWERARRT